MTDKSKDTPRLALLRGKLKARDGKPGFEKNCDALRAEIDRLENCRDLDL